ncbi:Aspartyl-tRNA(Asn) amidotransferase subunit C [Dissulfuribacter thermophilus]|uniref:Aspartyl/glutamyl-tRNA(Asn/Gln) amidotransferase subunit C n=1 Tax=Dissulfuribacter thermophilus TaxID=1156395 RepID=A0A1B9F951_9BACT|nr:Asp-tRNA(Asn)/Glu-tRNA(Gln) amidotransferase subunit GatC [Dissulfuribacter thermophilus]OCC16438.1 Aspartyl-tRNA(Asn) amidotransferase subunit C [Dissulfuribacter thermophilus]
MKITRGEVEHISELARLSFSEDELEVIANQLNDILGYIDKLNELDTAGIEPTTHAQELVNAFRMDEPQESLNVDDSLSNAPEREGGQFVVPRII